MPKIESDGFGSVDRFGSMSAVRRLKMFTPPVTMADARVSNNAAHTNDNCAKPAADHGNTHYPEAIAHLLTPKRRRTNVSAASFAAICRAIDKP